MEMTNGRLSSKNSYQNSISTFQFILHGCMDEHSIWYLLLCYLERSMLFTLIFSREYRFPANEKKKKKKIPLRAQKKTSDICQIKHMFRKVCKIKYYSLGSCNGYLQYMHVPTYKADNGKMTCLQTFLINFKIRYGQKKAIKIVLAGFSFTLAIQSNPYL